MYTSNPLHSFELRTEENKVVLFFEMKYEKTLAFSSRMCYTTKVHKSYLIYAIKRVRHSGVCRRKVGAAFFTKETPHKGFAQDMPAVFPWMPSGLWADRDGGNVRRGEES